MKKALSIILLILIFAPCPVSAEQTEKTSSESNGQKVRISGGPYIGYVGANFIHSLNDSRSTMKYGADIGGFLDMRINGFFSVQFELSLGYNVSEFERSGTTGEFRYCGLQIPIYAMFHVNLSKGGKVNIGLGPFTDFGFMGKYVNENSEHDVYKRDEATGLSTMKENYSGIAVKAGYEFRFGLQLNCTYKASLSNVLDENSSTVKMYPQKFSVEIAYRF